MIGNKEYYIQCVGYNILVLTNDLFSQDGLIHICIWIKISVNVYYLAAAEAGITGAASWSRLWRWPGYTTTNVCAGGYGICTIVLLRFLFTYFMHSWLDICVLVLYAKHELLSLSLCNSPDLSPIIFSYFSFGRWFSYLFYVRSCSLCFDV
jgi:hypothetical protein